MGGDMMNGTSDGTAGIGRRRTDGSPDTQFGPGGAELYWGMTKGWDLDVSCDGTYLLAGDHDYSRGKILRVWN